jgi:UDP-N-acetylmuramyl tripeptide synthase
MGRVASSGLAVGEADALHGTNGTNGTNGTTCLLAPWLARRVERAPATNH